jgi:hypothetical protein
VLLKQIARVSFLVMLMVALIVQSSDARGGSGGGAGGHGGGSGGRGGGSRGHGGWHHHGRHGHGAVVFGLGVGVGPWWWGGYPYWYGPGWYDPGYEPLVGGQSTVYIQGPPEPLGYWYYCPGVQAYYPQTATCDQPWIKVPPRRE